MNINENHKAAVERIFKNYLGGVLRLVGHSGETKESELERLGKYLFGDVFLGVFAKDEISGLKLKPGQMYIVNTLPRSTGGEHWMGVYGSTQGDLLFDSFARDKTIFPGWRGLRTEPDVDQLIQQKDCGQRTLAFLATAFVLGDLAYWV